MFAYVLTDVLFDISLFYVIFIEKYIRYQTGNLSSAKGNMHVYQTGFTEISEAVING